MFVTIFYGILDIRTGLVAYCNAGHNPPYVLRASGEVSPLERIGGLAVCLIKDFPFKAGTLTLDPGDALVVYTDGVTEALNSRSDLFSEERLVDTLGSLSDPSAAGIIRAIIRDVSTHAEHVPQSDDITAMAIRYQGA
jgi:sigma-B regulation protein RsbU (phosphoserine phosphatase)